MEDSKFVILNRRTQCVCTTTNTSSSVTSQVLQPFEGFIKTNTRLLLKMQRQSVKQAVVRGGQLILIKQTSGKLIYPVFCFP